MAPSTMPEVLALHFRPTEDLHGYTVVLEHLFTNRGLPVACHGDPTTILVRNDPQWSLEEELCGTQAPTHLGRVLAELGIGYIHPVAPSQGTPSSAPASIGGGEVSIEWRRRSRRLGPCDLACLHRGDTFT